MIEEKSYPDRFVVNGEKKSYPFFLKDMDYPLPGVFLYADKFKNFTPHIRYLENSENVSESIKKIKSNQKLLECLVGSVLGVSVIQKPDCREEMFTDIWRNLGYVPEGNKLFIQSFSNSLTP